MQSDHSHEIHHTPSAQYLILPQLYPSPPSEHLDHFITVLWYQMYHPQINNLDKPSPLKTNKIVQDANHETFLNSITTLLSSSKSFNSSEKTLNLCVSSNPSSTSSMGGSSPTLILIPLILNLRCPSSMSIWPSQSPPQLNSIQSPSTINQVEMGESSSVGFTGVPFTDTQFHFPSIQCTMQSQIIYYNVVQTRTNSPKTIICSIPVVGLSLKTRPQPLHIKYPLITTQSHGESELQSAPNPHVHQSLRSFRSSSSSWQSSIALIVSSLNNPYSSFLVNVTISAITLQDSSFNSFFLWILSDISLSMVLQQLFPLSFTNTPPMFNMNLEGMVDGVIALESCLRIQSQEPTDYSCQRMWESWFY